MRCLYRLPAAAAAVCVAFAPARAGAAAPPLLAPPVDAPISRRFDPPEHPWGPGHRGIDYFVAAGVPVRAAAAGRVTFAGAVGSMTAVTVQHAGGLETTYSNLADVHVTAGQSVGQGRWLGIAGSAHPGGPPGLHFGVKLNDAYVDPESYLGPVDLSGAIHLAPVRSTERDRGTDGGEADRCRTPESQPARPGAPNDNVVVVIAALNSSTMHGVPELFSVPGMLGYPDARTYYFSYRGHRGPSLHESYEPSDTHGDLRIAARRLGTLLRAVARRHPGVGVDLIAHSQGGIVAREFLAEAAEAWDPGVPPIEHLVTFASPHRGSPLAGAAGYMRRRTLTGGWFLTGVGELTGGEGWLPHPAATSVRQMDPESPLMRRLAREDVLFGTRVLALGIEEDLMVPADHALYPHKTGRIVERDTSVFGAHRRIVDSPRALALAHAFLRDVAVGCPEASEAAAVARAEAISFAERSLGPLYGAAERAALDLAPGLGAVARLLPGLR